MKVRKLLLLAGLLALSAPLAARVERGAAYREAYVPERDTTTTFGERLTWTTNVVDWALLAPNLGLEIDLGDPLRVSQPSLLFNFKYRIDNHAVGSVADGKVLDYRNPFTFWNGRLELRRHFRVSERREQRRGLARPALGIVNALSGKERTKERTDRVVESTARQHPEWVEGRGYAGFFAEYWNYTLNTKLDLLDHGKLKTGQAMVLGLSGGYDFPAYNWNQKHFVQLQVGASVGVMYAPHDVYDVDPATRVATLAKAKQKSVLPMVTELRLALNYRKRDIRRKYWRMKDDVYLQNIRANTEINTMADSIRNAFSTGVHLFIDVPALDKKGRVAKPLTKREVVDEICRQTGMQLDYNSFYDYDEKIFPIKKLDEYSIGYRFKKKQETFSQKDSYEDVNIRFRVQLKGRTEAEAEKEKLLAAIRKYRDEHDGEVPVIYGRAKRNSGDRTAFERPIARQDVINLFSKIYGRQLDKGLFQEFSIRKAAGVYEPVADKDMTAPTLYAVRIVYHPQVEISYDNDEVLALFKAEFRFDNYGKNMYELVNGHEIVYEEKWNGTKSKAVKRTVTPQDIVESLRQDGINGITVEMVTVADQTDLVMDKRYHAKVNLQAGYQADVVYMITDTEAKTRAEKAQADIMAPWIARKQFPEAHAARRADGRFDLSPEQVRRLFSEAVGYDFQGYQFLDYGLETEPQKMADGRYRAVAKVQLHYTTQIMNIPYYIVEKK